MEINLKDKITYKNLYGILSLISNVNTLDLNGVEKGPISKVNINNNLSIAIHIHTHTYYTIKTLPPISSHILSSQKKKLQHL